MNARLVVCALLLAWPLQSLDDEVRSVVLAHRPPVLAPAVHLINDHGRAIILPALGVAIFCGQAGRALALESAVALVPVNLAVEILKWGVDRPRPDGSRDRRNSSFPSSHAANACTLAAVIGRRWRRVAIPAWLLAVFVAYSRLYVDRHWFSDVLGAAALAVAGAWLATRVIARWRSGKTAVEVS